MGPELLDEVAGLAADLRAVVETWREAGVTDLPGAAAEDLVLPDLGPAPAASRGRRQGGWQPPEPTRAPQRTAPPPPKPAAPTRPRMWDPGPRRGPDPAPEVVRAEAPDFGVVPPGAKGLAHVQEVLGDCTRCGLCKSRRTLVFGVGDPDADLLICGEGPGANEDRQGVPFVGPAGQMLDKMLEHVLGLEREQVYILNVVKCRPPGNRTPLPEEIAACRPFLDAQIAAIQPKVILSLGRPATQTLLKTGRGIKSMRGTWQRLGDVPVMPTFHPAYLLRQAQDKRLTFQDLKELRQRYDALGGRR